MGDQGGSVGLLREGKGSTWEGPMRVRAQDGYGQPKAELHDPPLLFHLGRDASEKRNVAAQYPDVLARTKPESSPARRNCNDTRAHWAKCADQSATG